MEISNAFFKAETVLLKTKPTFPPAPDPQRVETADTSTKT